MSARTASFTGTTVLTKLALRRDRVMIPSWVLVVTLLALATTSSFQELYPTTASRLPFARSIESNPGLMALTGRGFDMTTTGGLVAWRIGGSGALLAAIMSMLLVVRHTRAEEESDRLELLGSAVVGRLAPLAAGVLTALLANLAIVVVVAAALIGLGLPALGSIVLALGFAAAGVAFAALAAISAQLTESARAANGITAGLVGAAYLLRAVGDSTDAGWVSWLSPIGWSQQVRAFADERWWVLGLAVAVTGVLIAIAFRLALHRDLGAGVLPTRPGPAYGADWLRTPLALAWRLQRGALLGWAIGFVMIGAVYGGLAQSAVHLVDSSSGLRDVVQSLGGQQLVVDAFLSTMIAFAALAAAAYAVQSVLRLAGEEISQRAEPVLATGVGRVRWALGHLVISLAGVAILMTLMGLSAGLVHGARSGDLGDQLLRVLGAALVPVLAVWVFAALVMALFGLAPKWVSVGWGAIGVAALILLVGSLANLNHWLMDLSPFTHLPKLPGGDVNWTPLFWLLAITLALCSAGLLGLRRRDIR